MSEYRKKPVVIEAVKWTGDNLREIIDFTGLHPSANKWTWDEYAAVVREDGLKIFTLEGSYMATVGDMIIKGVQGEFYPCKPDIFAATYEATELAGQDATVHADQPTPRTDDHGNPFGTVYELAFQGSRIPHDFVDVLSYRKLERENAGLRQQLENEIARSRTLVNAATFATERAESAESDARELWATLRKATNVSQLCSCDVCTVAEKHRAKYGRKT